MSTQTLAVAFLAAAAVGGVAYVFLYPTLSGEKKAEQRRASVARAQPAARVAPVRGQKSRREHVEDSLKDLETKQKQAKSPPLQVRIAQAGLGMSKNQFLLLSAGVGLLAFLLVLGLGGGLLPAAGIGFAGAFGVPAWGLKFLKKRREKLFLKSFPDAIDVIVRGIKAGLPLLDCLRVISNEAPEPVRTEFKGIIDTQMIGMPLGEACVKLYDRMPLPEANFFGIVIAIQQKAGGNLSEALGNLSKVLRERKRMAAKIQAMSMEAKASAGIIAALPLAVMTIVYVTSPEYIGLLFTDPMGRMMLAACATWMLMGVLVMKKMISFDF
jgi:tight adherence protein B